MVSTDLLRQVRLFRGLNQEEIDIVAEATSEWECPRGQYVFKEGDKPEVLYIIESGEVCIQVSTGFLVNHIICKIGPGEVFGELGFVDHRPRTAAVRCTQQAKLITISLDEYRRLGKHHPNIQRIIYKNIANVIADRLRQANEKLCELAGRNKSLVSFLRNPFTV